jgi:hypothetical protein
MRHTLGVLLLPILIASPAVTQPAQRVIIGADGVSWASGGGQRDPTVLIKRRGHSVTEDTTNAPGDAIDFDHRPGWISPRHFDADDNIAARVLSGEGSINLEGAFYGATSSVQLMGTVNGDHDVAFERKPDIFNTTPPLRNVWVILDFTTPVGIHRVRFYPRNTVVPTPLQPFHEDFLRAYELWVNADLTDLATPDRLVRRDTANESRVVDIELAPQYVRLVKLRSLSTVPYEFDEIEVYGTGYMAQGSYLSDIVELGDRATIGPLTWVQEVLGDPLFSALTVRLRTGVDDTPIRYQKKVRDSRGIVTGWTDVTAEHYYSLDRGDRAPFSEDTENWSPWTQVDNGALPAAPGPRRFVQFRLEFDGGLFETHQVDRIGFDYLVPPLADALTAEIYPRLAEAERPATFRYAVRLEADGDVRGFDHLEVDTNVGITAVREVTLNGLPYTLEVESIREDGFVLRFPLVHEDGALLEFTFDLPIFRFGTTFSGRASRSGVAGIPQRLTAGNAVDFDPGDGAELSGLFVAIPKAQIGKLVGEILPSSRVFSPNGDGINDRFDIAFNLLQLLAPAPVSFGIFDLGGRRVRHVLSEERGIGPAGYAWDGRRDDGTTVVPGIYVWVLEVSADALKERHTGTVGVAY